MALIIFVGNSRQLVIDSIHVILVVIVADVPDKILAAVAVPENIAGTVPIEIAHSGEVPIIGSIRQSSTVRHLVVADAPDQILAAVTVPENVAGTVPVEIGHSGDMPIVFGRAAPFVIRSLLRFQIRFWPLSLCQRMSLV